MKKSVINNIIIVLACSLVAKGLSYIWEASLAAYLGANDEADCLYMMVSIFNILYPVIDIGIWKVFMPIYKTKLAKNENVRANTFANISISFFFVLSLVLIAILVAFAKPLTVLIAPGFSPEKKSITAQFIRIAAPLYLTMATSSVLGAILQSHGKFFGSQLREIGASASKILFLMVCYKYFGIYAAVSAFIVGSICRVIIQLPFINWEWKFKPDFHFKNKDILTMLKGLPSVALTSAVSHINSLIDRVFASNSFSGSVACLNYGNKLMNVFSGMVSASISTATYPTMIQYIAEKNESKLKDLLANTIDALTYIIIPISLYCILFAKKIVIIAFQRGAFDASATQLTATIFIGYSVGMLFIGLRTVISNVFYGYGDTKITMYITIFGIALNVGLNFLLYHFWGVAGLAFATSISGAACHFIRLWFLRKFISFDYKHMFLETGKILMISIFSVGSSFLLFYYVIHVNPYIQIACSFILAVVIFFLCSKVFHIYTYEYIIKLIKNRINKKTKSQQ